MSINFRPDPPPIYSLSALFQAPIIRLSSQWAPEFHWITFAITSHLHI